MKARPIAVGLLDGSLTVCVRCHLRAAAHFTRDKPRQRNLCCECFIEEGHLPSHWHPACTRAYHRKHSAAGPSAWLWIKGKNPDAPAATRIVE